MPVRTVVAFRSDAFNKADFDSLDEEKWAPEPSGGR
jgi:hypothetical protein